MPAHGSELPGNLPHDSALFHNHTTNQEPKSCPLPAAPCWRSRLCPEGARWGGRNCLSFWALWVLSTFQSSHAAAKKEFCNLSSHPAPQGSRQARGQCCLARRERPGLRLCPLLLLPVSSLPPCNFVMGTQLASQGCYCSDRAATRSTAEVPMLATLKALPWGGR